MTQSEHWTTSHVVAYENAAIKLLAFRTSEDARDQPILIIPPQAGHHSYIADYAEGQSLVATALASSDLPVYAIEFKSCTFERKREDYNDLLSQVTAAISRTGKSKAHLVGLCQGGTLASIYAAVYPMKVASLTVAGAPIDVQASPSALSKALKTPLWQYEVIVALGAGLIHGEWMLANWKAPNAKKHYIDRYLNPSERNDTFYKWYDLTQNIAGSWYLWLIENLFIGNKLINDEMVLPDGTEVRLGNIKCRIYLIAGERDDISPPDHTFNMADKIKGFVNKQLIPDAGHIGVFMGPKSMPYWAAIFKEMGGQSV